jgi:hypothetical protein
MNILWISKPALVKVQKTKDGEKKLKSQLKKSDT